MIPAQSNFVGETLDRLFGISPAYGDPIGYAVLGVVAFVAVYVLGRAVLLPVADRAMERRDLDRHARKPLKRLVFFLVLFVAAGAAFAAAGRGNILMSLATIAAAATIAIGFAMQDVLKNFVSGVFIYAERPFVIGDWIEWEGNSGVVEDISLRVTRVRTFDNELLTVPNAQLTENVVKNPVDADRLRVKVEFGIGYDDDIDAATDVILDEAEAHDEILADPAPSVRLTELGDSDVGLQSRIWIAQPSRADFVKVRGEYVQSVKERFDEVGIDIPYPHRVVTGGLEFSDGPVAERSSAEGQAADGSLADE